MHVCMSLPARERTFVSSVMTMELYTLPLHIQCPMTSFMPPMACRYLTLMHPCLHANHPFTYHLRCVLPTPRPYVSSPRCVSYHANPPHTRSCLALRKGHDPRIRGTHQPSHCRPCYGPADIPARPRAGKGRHRGRSQRGGRINVRRWWAAEPLQRPIRCFRWRGGGGAAAIKRQGGSGGGGGDRGGFQKRVAFDDARSGAAAGFGHAVGRV